MGKHANSQSGMPVPFVQPMDMQLSSRKGNTMTSCCFILNDLRLRLRSHRARKTCSRVSLHICPNTPAWDSKMPDGHVDLGSWDSVRCLTVCSRQVMEVSNNRRNTAPALSLSLSLSLSLFSINRRNKGTSSLSLSLSRPPSEMGKYSERGGGGKRPICMDIVCSSLRLFELEKDFPGCRVAGAPL